MDYYLVRCERCKKKTRHMEHLVNVLRGVKVRCCSCGNIRNRYFKCDSLQKLKVEVASDLGIISNPKILNLNQEAQNGEK